MADSSNTQKTRDSRPSPCALGSGGKSMLDDTACPALLRALLDHIPALAYAKDEQQRWVFFNERFRQSSGLPAEELLGMVDTDILPPHIAAWVREHDTAVLKTGQPMQSEAHVVDLDGTPRYLSSYKNIWIDPYSNRRYILGFIMDVSSHRRIEREHQTILEIVENGPAVLVRCRMEPGLPIDYISPSIERFGLDPDELISHAVSFESLIDEEDLAEVLEESKRRISETRDSFVQEYRIRTDAGMVRRIEDYVFIERDSEGIPRFRESLLLDVTARYEAAQALAASEARYRTLAENFPNGSVVLFDTDLRFTLAEGRGLKFVELSRQKLVGLTVWEAFAPEIAEFLAERYGAALLGKKSLFEMSYKDRHYEVRIVPLRDPHNEITGGMVVSHDITRRKEAENALAELNANLENLVAERTAELERQARELEEANRKFKRLDELKSSFLSAVSHELRTPLTSIFGFTKLISRDLDKHLRPLIAASEDTCSLNRLDRVLDNLAVIEHEGSRLTRLINDVLDLTRIESGRMAWRDSRIQIADCIYEAVLSVSSQFFEKDDLQLEADVPRNLPDVIADPDRIVQVVVNLLGNAAKFTSRGVVRIRARQVEEEIAVFVSDTGAGIKADELERVFDKFHQSHAGDTLCRTESGSGLGLAICKDIVERYGGRIWVRSSPGVGSVFTFTIPVAPQKEASAT